MAAGMGILGPWGMQLQNLDMPEVLGNAYEGITREGGGRWDAPDWTQASATDSLHGPYGDRGGPDWVPGTTFERKNQLAAFRDAWTPMIAAFQGTEGFTDNIHSDVAKFLGRDVDGDGVHDPYRFSSAYSTPPAEGETWGRIGAPYVVSVESAERGQPLPGMDGQRHRDVYPDLLRWMLQQSTNDPEGAIAGLASASQQPGWMTFSSSNAAAGQSMGQLDIGQARLEALAGGADLSNEEEKLAGIFMEDIARKNFAVQDVIRPQAEATRRYLNQTPQASDRQMRSRAFTGGPDSRARSTATRSTSGSLLGGEDERRPTRSLLGGRGRSLGIGGY